MNRNAFSHLVVQTLALFNTRIVQPNIRGASNVRARFCEILVNDCPFDQQNRHRY